MPQSRYTRRISKATAKALTKRYETWVQLPGRARRVLATPHATHDDPNPAPRTVQVQTRTRRLTNDLGVNSAGRGQILVPATALGPSAADELLLVEFNPKLDSQGRPILTKGKRRVRGKIARTYVFPTSHLRRQLVAQDSVSRRNVKLDV